MARRSSGPTVARRRLGNALRALREDANIRLERAAAELECSIAKVSRIENGLGPTRAVDVRALLDLYALRDANRRAQFESWAAATKSAGWWEPDADLTDDYADRYLAFETEAATVRSYCTPVLPAILQTPRYALSQVRAFFPDLSEADSQRYADLRLARQTALLDQTTDLSLKAVIDEGAIRREVGSPEVLAEQLDWLLGLLDRQADENRADVEVRILPFAAGVPGRALSAISIFTPRDRRYDHDAAYVEHTGGARWYESNDDVDALAALFAELQAVSLTPRASREYLRER